MEKSRINYVKWNILTSMCLVDSCPLEMHDEIYGNDESKTLNVAVLDW